MKFISCGSWWACASRSSFVFFCLRRTLKNLCWALYTCALAMSLFYSCILRLNLDNNRKLIFWRLKKTKTTIVLMKSYTYMFCVAFYLRSWELLNDYEAVLRLSMLVHTHTEAQYILYSSRNISHSDFLIRILITFLLSIVIFIS